jgi:hypothetical protein
LVELLGVPPVTTVSLPNALNPDTLNVPPVLFVNVAVPAEYVPPLTNISVNADTLRFHQYYLRMYKFWFILFAVAVRNISVNADTLNVPPVLFVKV